MGQLQGELADAFKKQWISEASLKAATRQRDYLKQENSRLQEDLDKAKAKVGKLCKCVYEAVLFLARAQEQTMFWEQIQERFV